MLSVLIGCKSEKIASILIIDRSTWNFGLSRHLEIWRAQCNIPLVDGSWKNPGFADTDRLYEKVSKKFLKNSFVVAKLFTIVNAFLEDKFCYKSVS